MKPRQHLLALFLQFPLPFLLGLNADPDLLIDVLTVGLVPALHEELGVVPSISQHNYIIRDQVFLNTKVPLVTGAWEIVQDPATMSGKHKYNYSSIKVYGTISLQYCAKVN